jgi:hypothetical protein
MRDSVSLRQFCLEILTDASAPLYSMAHVSFALLEAHRDGATVEQLSLSLGLTIEFVQNRIEAARLCLLALEQLEQLERL